MLFQQQHASYDNMGPYKEGKQWTKSFMLGSGAFSTCFQARDEHSGTLMAVKQVQLNRVQDEDEKVNKVPFT